MPFSWSMNDLKVVYSCSFSIRLASCPSGCLKHDSHVNEICDPSRVWTFFQGGKDGTAWQRQWQQVAPFESCITGIQSVAGISDNSLSTTIIQLWEDSSYSSVIGIRVQNESFAVVWEGKDRGSGQPLLKLFESDLAVPGPVELGCLFSESMEGFSNIRKILDKSTVVN